MSTLPFPDNSYVYNYPVKQNNVFNAPNNFRAGRIDEGRVPRSGVRADSLERDHRREPGGAAERELLPRAGRTCTKGRCTPSTWRSSASCPARFTLDVAYVGNRGHDVQTQFNENAATVVGAAAATTAGRCSCRSARSADVTTWIGTKTEYNSLQVKLDRRFSGGLLVDVVVHARTRVELRERRQQHDDRDAGRHRSGAGRAPIRIACTASSRASSISCRSDPTAAGCSDGPLSQVLGGWQVSGIFSAQSGSPISITMPTPQRSTRRATRSGRT